MSFIDIYTEDSPPKHGFLENEKLTDAYLKELRCCSDENVIELIDEITDLRSLVHHLGRELDHLNDLLKAGLT